MSNNIVYFNKDRDVTINKDGSLIVRGKTEQGTTVNLQCDPTVLCTATLKANNAQNVTTTSINLFKLTDIPNVMELKGWKQAAFLQRKWFNESAVTMKNEEKGKWSTSNPKLDYYDPSRFNHEWLSKFSRYNISLVALKSKLLSKNAKKNIVKILALKRVLTPSTFTEQASYQGRSNYHSLTDTENLKKFHQDWQFQYQGIDNTLPRKLVTATGNLPNPIDNLWAAFGAFNIYAGIGDYKVIFSKSSQNYTIIIQSIICYAIDSYDFIIEKSSNKNDYLGHWNKNNVTFSFSLLDQNTIENTMMVVVDDTGTTEEYFIPEKLFYPIFNQHYQSYRQKHNKGRDMVIWTKPHTIKLEPSSAYTFIVTQQEIDKIW